MADIKNNTKDSALSAPSDEEKQTIPDQCSMSSRTWSAAEEKRLLLKIDFLVLGTLTCCFFFFQLDRANIGNALTDNFLADVGITQNWYNVGQQLLNVGIVILEIPSNIILCRVGPKYWIGAQIMLWGLVATFQAFQRGLGAFLSTRLLLGLLESGFIPGCLYVISLWYKTSELSRRFGYFFLGNGIAQACSGLMAYGILHMRGVGDLAGWQWMFILEGLMTLLSGILFLSVFPGSPSNPTSVFRVLLFDEHEIMIMQNRLVLDDDTNTSPHQIKITGSDVLDALKNWKIWPHVTMTIAGLAPTTALWSYAPTITASFGYGKLESNALVSVGQWISVCLIIVAAFAADKSGRRDLVILFGVTCEFSFMLALKCLPDQTSGKVKFGVLTMATATCSWWHSVHGSWLAINARNQADKSIRMAIFIIGANCAGIVGGQLFRSDDLPYYHRGWDIIAALMSLAMACVITLVIAYAMDRKKHTKQ